MSKQIQLEEAKQAELEKSIQKMKDGCDDVLKSLKTLEASVSSSLKGEAAEHLKNAISQLKNKLNDSISNWDKVKDDAVKIADGLKEADKEAAK